jgi:hypothetical protein
LFNEPFCVSVLVTTTVTAPAACAGVVAVMDVGPTTFTLVAVVPPKLTVAPVRKPVPVMVTAVPPEASPVFGETEVTVGAGLPPVYVNALVRLPERPVELVTVTVTVPAPAGVVAEMVVLFSTVTFVAAVAPKVTAAPAANLVPVMVTSVPPLVGPVAGPIPVTVGVGAEARTKVAICITQLDELLGALAL